MNKNFRSALAGIVVSAAVMHANVIQAHGRWIVPNQFIFSGEEPVFVTVDMSISNEVFHPDYSIGGDRPGAAKSGSDKNKKQDEIKLLVTTPDGKENDSAPLVDLVRKTSAAVLLEQSGTYRLTIQQPPVYFTWYDLPNGEKSRSFGKPSQARKHLPDGVSNIIGTSLINRVETYITRNKPNTKAITPPDNGLALAFQTHPGELFVGERAQFTLLMDGRPVTSATPVKLTREDTRYRNQRNTIEIKTGKKGAFSVEFPESGIYLLEAEIEQPSKEKGIETDTFALFVTLEVQPE